MSKQPPPAPTASAAGPCPSTVQISRTPGHWKFTQHHRTTRPPFTMYEMELCHCLFMVWKQTYTVKKIRRFYGKIPGIWLPVLLPLFLRAFTCRTFLEIKIW